MGIVPQRQSGASTFRKSAIRDPILSASTESRIAPADERSRAYSHHKNGFSKSKKIDLAISSIPKGRSPSRTAIRLCSRSQPQVRGSHPRWCRPAVAGPILGRVGMRFLALSIGARAHPDP